MRRASCSKLNIACSKKMAVVNICRAAWKGPRVTRRGSFSFSLLLLISLLPEPSFLLLTVRDMSLSEFQARLLSPCAFLSPPFFLFLFCSHPARAHPEKQIIPARRSKTTADSSSRRTPPNPQRRKKKGRQTRGGQDNNIGK